MSDNEIDEVEVNDQLILVGGYSGTGKSASLRNIRNPDRWVYLNCESGKRLPFRSKFNQQKISDPLDVPGYFDDCIANRGDVDGIIIDTLTFLMDMYESQYVIGSANTMAAWSDYAQFFKNLMQRQVTLFNKPVIILAHNRDENEESGIGLKTSVPIKGSLKNNGIEAYFSTVVAAKKLVLKDLKEGDFDPKLLNITDEEKALGFKHVFQTRITKGTTGERIRGPMGLWKPQQTFVDNDVQMVIDHLNTYFGQE